MIPNVKSIDLVAKINQARSFFAPYWRKMIGISICLLGFAIYFGAEYGLATLIVKNQQIFGIVLLIGISTILITIAYPFWGYAIWFFLTMYLNLFNNVLPAKFNFDLLMLSFITVVLIVRALAQRSSLGKFSMAELLLILFFIYGHMIRHDFTASGGTVVTGLKYALASPFFYYFISKSILKERKHIYWLMLVIIVTGVSFAAMGIYEQISGRMWLAGLYGIDVSHGMRSTGPAGNYYVYGNMLILTFLLCLHVFKWQKAWHSKAALVIACIVALIGLYFGYSRAPYIAFVVSLLIMLVLTRYTRRVYLVFGGLILLSAIVILPYLLDKSVVNRMQANTWDARSSITKTSMNMFGKNFWFGVGKGQYVDAVPKYMAFGHIAMKRPSGLTYQYSRPHSEYFLMLAELGITGFLIYFMIYILFLFLFMKLRTKLPQNTVAGGDFACLAVAYTIAVLLTMATDQFGDFPYMYVIVFTLFAMVKKAEFFATKERAELPSS